MRMMYPAARRNFAETRMGISGIPGDKSSAHNSAQRYNVNRKADLVHLAIRARALYINHYNVDRS